MEVLFFVLVLPILVTRMEARRTKSLVISIPDVRRIPTIGNLVSLNFRHFRLPLIQIFLEHTW